MEWLGEVPEHWALPPLHARYEVLLGKMLDEKQNLGTNPLPYVRNIDVQWDCVNTTALPLIDIPPDERPRFTLRAGDLLVCEGGEVGRTAIWRGEVEPCSYQKALHRLRPRSGAEQPRYLYFCMRFAVDRGAFEAGGNGSTIIHLTAEKLRAYRLPVPPVDEQVSIAAFLDRETTKIDALIAEQQRLIELMREKRQAVISHAVTKGLNPVAPMKPSGAAWLGDVPAHWELGRLAIMFREVTEPGEDHLPVLSVSIHDGVSDREFADDELERQVNRSEDRTKYKRVKPGDLVYNMMRAWQGGFGTVTVEGMVSPAYVVARPQLTGVTRFVEHLLRTPQAVEQMRRHSQGVTDFRLRLYWAEFKNLRIALPPLPELTAICEAIAAMDRSFDALTVSAERAISLLQERRAALISAAVTGKIDVRGLVDVDAA